MRIILNIAFNDLLIFFRDRGNLIGLVVLPIALTMAVGWANSSRDNGPTYLLLDVIDQDQSPLSAEFLAQLRLANENLLLCPSDDNAVERCGLGTSSPAPDTLDQALAMQRVQQGETSGLLMIPAGYGVAVTNVQPLQLDYYSTDDPALPGVVRQAVESVLQRVNQSAVTARVGARLVTELTTLLTHQNATLSAQNTESDLASLVYQHAEQQSAQQLPAVHYTTTKADTAAISGIQNGFGQSVPGMSTLYVIFTVLGGTMALLRERRQWTLQRLVALPVTRAQILGGKITTYFTLGMIQYAIVFAAGVAVGLDLGDDWGAMLVLMMAFTLCMTALTMALATRVTSEGQANGLRNLIGLTLAPLGGAWWPLEIVPTFMQRIGYLSPVAWVMDGFHKLIFNQAHLVDILPEIGILLVIALVLFGIGIRGFRIQ